MIIDELIEVAGKERLAPNFESDPFSVVNSFLESQIASVRFDAVNSRMAILLDLRQSLQFDEGNTAILVVSGVCSFRWSVRARIRGRVAWSVVGSETSLEESVVSLDFDLSPSARLQISAVNLGLLAGTVEVDDVPPDFTTDSAVRVAAQSAHWDSSINLAAEAWLRSH